MKMVGAIAAIDDDVAVDIVDDAAAGNDDAAVVDDNAAAFDAAVEINGAIAAIIDDEVSVDVLGGCCSQKQCHCCGR